MTMCSSTKRGVVLLRHIRNGDLRNFFVAYCSSLSAEVNQWQLKAKETNDSTKTPKKGQRVVRTDDDVEPKWIDVNRKVDRQPGNFHSRNVSFDRFFDTHRRHGRSTIRDQWTKRTVMSTHSKTGGSWSEGLNMPKVDYESLNLLPLQKDFYKEHPSVASRSEEEITEWLVHNKVIIEGNGAPRPVFGFDEAGFPKRIVEGLKLAGFHKPTEIQSVSWPVALRGHDMISVARTGSGKTLAYILPGIVHLQNQQQSENVCSPSVLVLAPTRELVQQISTVTKKFHTKVGCAYGGTGRDQQARIIRGGIDILAAAPGRLLDFLVAGVFTLHQCTYLVLDEADRMLDMGFEPQIRKIISLMRPDRQTLMFSATWPKEIRILAKDFLTEPIFVNVGSVKLAANHNIKQLIEVVEENQKEDKLFEFLDRIAREPSCKILIFVGMKRTADWLMRLLRKRGYPALSLHGDKSQTERNFVMKEFKCGKCSVLIATDIAARGLDVYDIGYVINFDCPKNAEDYIHRIGRTARHDKTGTSYTLCTSVDGSVITDLIEVLKEAGQTVPSDLWMLSSGRRSATLTRGPLSSKTFAKSGTWCSDIQAQYLS